MKRGADYLLIDVSNSYAKFAFASRKRISTPVRVPTRRISTPIVAGFVRERDVRKVVVSSVVPAKNHSISNAVKKNARLLWVNCSLNLGVRIDYSDPQTIGADRLANAAAAAEMYGVPAIVIDFGTAATFDVVSAQSTYIGGVIAPGLEAMSNFLYDRTALLPRISFREPRCAVGKSTIEAMRSGAVFGYRGLVREILARIKEERFAGKSVCVVATGGYATLVARALPEIGMVRPNLTLEGLRIIGNLND
jgi:type III pantothenate kinase